MEGGESEEKYNLYVQKEIQLQLYLPGPNDS